MHGVKRQTVSGEADPSTIRVFFSHHVFFRIRSLKLCKEFITSKTFLLEFANYKTFVNNILDICRSLGWKT